VSHVTGDLTPAVLSSHEIEPNEGRKLAEIVWSARWNDEQVHLFGDFVLDTKRGCLLQAGQDVHLRPQAYAALAYLAASRGRLVTKGQLTTVVWGGRAVIDDSLVQCVGDIRRALEDKDGTRLRTVRGRGYLLETSAAEATVTGTDDPDGKAAEVLQDSVAPVSPVRAGLGIRRRAIAAATFVAAGAAIAVLTRAANSSFPRETETLTFTKLTASDSIEVRPSLSPDGRWLLFDSLTPPDFDADTQVLLKPLIGGATTCVTCGTPGGGIDGAFSPTGDRIAFTTDSRDGGIVVVGRDGSSPHRITSQGFHPSWSPDGTVVAYGTRRSDWIPVSWLDATSELRIVDVTSGRSRRLDVGDARDLNGHRMGVTSRSGPKRALARAAPFLSTPAPAIA